ncbi:heparinase II/III domain-containing protein [Namhaeicola litoreus]|uniref:Heparinase II/III family protein n=1 Tax=Namhaeicola litoreus TaxID=1052145 RepID=A0ABW3Y718_9FLAO
MIKFYLTTIFLVYCFSLTAQQLVRPFILVKADDRAGILQKIEKQAWAKDTYSIFIEKIQPEVKSHQTNPEAFLKGMPFDWAKVQKGEIPPFYKTIHIQNGKPSNLDNATKEEWKNGRKLIRFLQIAQDCAIAYYLTEDEKYAECAIDILNGFTQSVLQSKVSDWHGRGGWLFPDDGFREVREIGVKVPIIYDFIAEYIRKGGKPYDIFQKSKIEFPQEKAQQVFRTYADITINYGHIGSNHPVLEAPSLVYNALAMEDETERNQLLSYFLTENTENQDALPVMANNYKNEGDIWPETSQYLNGVATILTRLMLVVNRYDPTLHLGERYSNVLFALPALDYLVYPNNEIIRWGDGKRHGKPNYSSYEDAYLLGEMDEVDKVTNKFGPLIQRALDEGKYGRNDIDAVLMHGLNLPDTTNAFELPRTDKVDHAGIFLQRNLTNSNKAENDLMCFVGGAHMVHGHAEGMNIELYGKGQVLGVDNGRGSYQQDIHENYSRIWASHNSVIVNGSSQGEGGWANLGINKVQLIAMEPKPMQKAVSPLYSFTQTSFIDDKGNQAEARQERTLALIRTSETTGYYVDVFRSKSNLPNEYHDYLYHNIGDKLTFLNKNLALKPTPNRYMSNGNEEWIQNKKYRNPGWHFFKEVETSLTYSKDVKFQFSIEKLEKSPIYMKVHMPGFDNREYTKVMAPHTFEAPKPYDELPTPTLVVRKKGDAWSSPFVAVYEPFSGNMDNASIVSVEKLEQNGIYKGLKIISSINKSRLVQYVITQSKDEVYQDKNRGIYFKGIFAIITTNAQNDLQNVYIGEGEKLSFKNKEFFPTTGKNSIFLFDIEQ